MNTDKDLDHLLSMRRAVDVPPGLAQRIVNMAQPRKPKQDSWADIWADFQSMFMLPRPAYALALAAIFGLLIGFDTTTSQADPVYSNFTSFLQADADIDEGNWL